MWVSDFWRTSGIERDVFLYSTPKVRIRDFFVNFDLKEMGVAGDNSWGARPYEEYSVPAQDYVFEFTMEPVF